MRLVFSEAWDNYLYWQKTDPKLLKRINALIQEIQRSPFAGTGKPEALKLFEKSLTSLNRHLAKYRPQLERALAAVKLLQSTDPNSEEFSQVLLHGQYQSQQEFASGCFSLQVQADRRRLNCPDIAAQRLARPLG